MKKILFMIIGSIYMSQALASIESPMPFKIKEIFLSAPTNFHFRVMADYVDPNAWHCHNGPKNPAWSYINESDPGAKGMMSALLTAYAANKTVTLFTEGVDSSIGRVCRIVEFSISD
ncbi:MAG: hypothetical protein KJO91_00630 [Gammaproteobacteria bacterium]|nr:hypothetical protein [Gammaproteobacteria bacterium]